MNPWMMSHSLGLSFGFASWLWPLALLDVILKGFALWRASKNNQLYWFIALLLVNSLGILPLIYLIVVDKNYVFQTLKKKYL